MRRYAPYSDMQKPSYNCLPILIVLILLTTVVHSQEIKGVAATGSQGITIGIEELQRISDITPVRKKLRVTEEIEFKRRPQNHPAAPAVSAYPNEGFSQNDVSGTQTVLSNFQAITLSESSSVPPDCMGDVSETQVCIAANGRIKFFAKPSVCDAPLTTATTGGSATLGNPQYNIDLDAFFNAVRNNSGTTDPHVHYDRLTGRWFVVAINVASKSNRVLIAVSNTASITATSSFTFYYFIHDQGTINGGFDYQRFADFPMVSIDKNALYVGALVFDASNNTYEGASCYVVKKTSILSGGTLSFTAFRRIGTASSGIYGPNPAYNDDPQATKGYFVGVNAANYGVINFVVINDPGGTPTSTTGSFTVPLTDGPVDQVAKGSTRPLDAGDDRLLNVQMMKNKLTGTSTIWTAQNVAVDAAGIANSSGTALRNAVRWYELNVASNAVSLKQSGTWYDNTATGANGYWMGSIAGNGQGHALAGASIAGPNKTPNAIIAGRYSSQAQGQLANTVPVTAAVATYNAETTDKQRWGDYSQTVVDPSDNMTMWTFQEYANAANSWAERAVQTKSPPPATPLSLSQIACNTERTTEVVLTGQSTDNSGFFDPGPDAGGPGFTKHLTVTSTGNVSISNVTLDNATQVRFVINYSAATLGSAQTLTITNPDCQSVTFNYTLPDNCEGPVVTKPITIFPNPATSTIRITLQNSGGEIRMLDMTGRLMFVQTAGSTFVSIPSAGFARGVYIIQYINGSTKHSEKLLLM